MGQRRKILFFNDMARKWTNSDRTEDLKKAEMELDLLDIRQDSDVLDVGTGTGVLIPLLSNFTQEEKITAIDISRPMIDTARKNFPNSQVNFILGDVLTHRFARSSFDFVICYSVFPHFENQRMAFQHLAGLLKPDGKITIMHSASRRYINEMHGRKEPVKNDLLPSPEILRKLVRKCRLKEEIMIDTSQMFMLAARKGR
ncbi:MAG: class I SAM-dependent methyltransferase [Rickettsiales bacterium]|jgi:demethylmenaquinone methyltransferase/2-methoxy-6-polyprenyl-1,4-benzoquinol methylase|nr:class I SAM-dependent methyltransferase [Rickettsiales bacterium]